jgi:Na+/proline symporter
MFSPLIVIASVLLYIACLFLVAHFAERKVSRTGQAFNHPFFYALSLAVYHTSWTFYGSVGFATTSGLLFAGIYVGALIGIGTWWFTLRKMVAAKEAFRITSVADFISTRYRRSQRIAALVTLIALLGSFPYIALQLKAISNSFTIITYDHSSAWSNSGLIVTIIMTLFTIVFGVRRLDPTERHQGMIGVLVVESIVKLLALTAVGLFVCYGLYDGWGDIKARLPEAGLSYLTSMSAGPNSFSMWMTLIVLSFSGIILLPRQFHISVVENGHQKQIRTAMWMFPLYMIGINLFVIPIAAAGLLTELPADKADFFVLLLPQAAGQDWLTLLAFMGGFSAATGMIIITTMTLATMVSNHMLLPFFENFSNTHILKTHLLQTRWVLVALILFGSYWFETEFSNAYILVAIGLLSFVAILQFAPAAFIGLFWARGNSAGAFAGLLSGFLVWCYTLGLPTFIKQGWLAPDILIHGPWNLSWLRPEALFGLDHFTPVTHSVIWSLGVNTFVYIAGSMIYRPSKQERTLTSEFMAALQPLNSRRTARPAGLDAYIPMSIKRDEAHSLLAQYLSSDKADQAVDEIVEDLQVAHKAHITIIELMEFHRMLEHRLAGLVGAASAHSAIEQSIRYSDREASELKALYSHITSGLHQTQRASTSDTEEEDTHSGFGMINTLQSQVDQLETQLSEQTLLIQSLENKLESRFEEVFRYRIDSQRLVKENDDLRRQIEELSRTTSTEEISESPSQESDTNNEP